MSRKELRDSWSTYAAQQGLITNPRGGAILREGAALPSRNKYGAVKTTVDGITFASKKESVRYQELTLMQQAGQIARLTLQPVFQLHVMRLAYNETPICMTKVGIFTADFEYLDLRSGEYVIEDVKSAPTRTGEAYRLRKRLVEAVHGIVVTEV